MEYEQLVQDIFKRFPSVQKEGFKPGAYKPGLEGMIGFDEVLGRASGQFRSIHVAGTNGKGSVANMLASALTAAGYKTGLYTSPHLVDFRERARINGEMIPREYVQAFLEKWKPYFEAENLSFFEITTGMAFRWFADEHVDIAVVEAGLGGRLDSTNLLVPELSIITSIGLDHCALLGNTLEEIAFEKAGIMKPGVPALIGESNPATDPVFDAFARRLATKNALFRGQSDQNADLSTKNALFRGQTCQTANLATKTAAFGGQSDQNADLSTKNALFRGQSDQNADLSTKTDTFGGQSDQNADLSTKTALFRGQSDQNADLSTKTGTFGGQSVNTADLSTKTGTFGGQTCLVSSNMAHNEDEDDRKGFVSSNKADFKDGEPQNWLASSNKAVFKDMEVADEEKGDKTGLVYADRVEPWLWDRHEEILKAMDLQAPVQRKNLRTVLTALEVLGVAGGGDSRSEPGMRKEEPGMRKGKLGMTGEEPGMRKEEPGMRKGKFGMTGKVPGMRKEEPGMRKGKLGMTGEVPEMWKEEPGMAEGVTERIIYGIEHTAELMNFHGRWERINDKPMVIADIGHNAHALESNFKALEAMNRPLIVVYGIMADKDLDAIIPLMPKKARYIFVAPDTPRARKAEEVLARFKEIAGQAGNDEPQAGNDESHAGNDEPQAGNDACTAPSVKAGMEMAMKEADDNTVIYIGGSTFVVAEALSGKTANNPGGKRDML